jgi:hypothetical protein
MQHHMEIVDDHQQVGEETDLPHLSLGAHHQHRLVGQVPDACPSMNTVGSGDRPTGMIALWDRVLFLVVGINKGHPL